MPDIIDIDYEYSDELPHDIHGFTDAEKRIICINSSLVENPHKERFLRATIAHEIGHAILHIPTMQKMKQYLKLVQRQENGRVRLYRESNILPYENPEWQAWHFAKAILMPRATLQKLLNEGIVDSVRLADIYNVNPGFVRERLRNF